MLDIENQNAPIQEPPHGWIGTHPYASMLSVAAILIVVGAFIVIEHLGVSSPASQTTAWGGDIGALTNPTAYTPTGGAQNDILNQVQGSAPYSYTIPSLTASSAPQQGGAGDNSFNYQTFMSAGAQSGTNTSATPPTQTQDISYAFPPATLFSTSSAAARTDAQQALYNYGNEIGSYIQTYEQAHPNQTQVLKDQVEDPTNADKAQMVDRLAHDLTAIGASMAAMEEVPPQAASIHVSLAQDYQTMGQDLALVPRAQGSNALLQAIKIYNASADAFAKDFVALVGVFSTYGVTWGADEPGSAFTFSYSSGL